MSQLGTVLALLCLASSFQAERTLKVHLATWNVGESGPPASLIELLGLHETPLPDLVVLGTQESNGKLDPWHKTLSRVLKNYTNVNTVKKTFIQLDVFVLNEHKENIVGENHFSIDFYAEAISGKEKGANMLHVKAYNSSLCLINSHLEADCHKFYCSKVNQYPKRVKQFKTVMEHSKKTCPEQDFTFFMGDLNFRLNGKSFQEVQKSVEEKNYTSLLESDQLNGARKEEPVLGAFSEGDIKFSPTYKLIKYKKEYDSKRVPAWTDRILYKGQGLAQLNYASLPHYTKSDHRPVIATFTITVK